MNYDELHPSNAKALFLIAAMYAVVFLGVAIKLFNKYNSNQVEIQKLKSDNIEAELRFLKAQLHPHFLFNTLNNLYSLTLEKSEKASDVVLKLSELLDYVLYKCNSEFVPLNDEVTQMKNYIELEKLRYGERLDVDFTAPNIPHRVTIPPMLLMTLLENSFKHGVSKTMDNSWIKVDLLIDGETAHFEISNSKHTTDPKPGKSGGIGLKNIQNRLQLIYKDNFELKIKDDTFYFSVDLKLTN